MAVVQNVLFLGNGCLMYAAISESGQGSSLADRHPGTQGNTSHVVLITIEKYFTLLPNCFSFEL